jgi:hypothetical protein
MKLIGITFLYLPPQKKRGPCPMHEVVPIAVSAAVKIDIAIFIACSQKFLFFIAY